MHSIKTKLRSFQFSAHTKDLKCETRFKQLSAFEFYASFAILGDAIHTGQAENFVKTIVNSLFIAFLFDNFVHNDQKNDESKLLQIILVNDRTDLTAKHHLIISKGLFNAMAASDLRL